MPTGGLLGNGIRIGIATGSPHTWVEVTQVQDPVEIFKFNRDRVEVSTHGGDGEKTYIPGQRDVSDLTFPLLADLDRATSPSHMQLSDLEESQDIIWVRVGVPKSSDLDTCAYWVQEAQARVGAWGLNSPIDAARTIDIVMQYAGGGITQYESIAHASLFA